MLEFTKTVRGKEALDVLISVLKRGFKGRGLVSDKYIYIYTNERERLFDFTAFLLHFHTTSRPRGSCPCFFFWGGGVLFRN